MKQSIEKTFKKLLGNGRAFLTPKGFTDEFYDLFISPFVELKNKIIALKFTHFPSKNLILDDIKNGEELFALTDVERMSLADRAANVEAQWAIFAGCQNYKQIENILIKKGYPVKVIENIPLEVVQYAIETIGNGSLLTPTGKRDPVTIVTGKHGFIVQADDFMTSVQTSNLIDTIVKIKPAQNIVYFIPRFLRKKEIHLVLTKNQMQTYKKSQYCNVKS